MNRWFRRLARAGLALALYAWAVEPNWLRVRHRLVHLDESASDLDGLKILHVSDLHVGRSTDRIARFIRRAAAIEADVVALTGDFIAGPEGIPRIAEVLRPLTRRHTVVGVLGNHEHRFHTPRWLPAGSWRTRHLLDGPEMASLLADAGVEMLVNDSGTVEVGGRKVTFVGIDDMLGRHDDWQAALDGVDTPGSVVLLSHTPDAHAKASDLGIPLMLSGHTHGGQIRIGWLTPTTGTRYPLERPSGLMRKGGTVLHLSPGLGTTAVPLRFFARPEVTLLELSADRRS